MSYESSPIAETTSAIPSQGQPIMREPKEVDPYRNAQPRVPRETNGQTAISGEKAKAEVPVVSAESIQLSPQMAALARREQANRRKDQEVRAREQSLEAGLKEFEELKALKAKLAAKDYSGIEDLVKYDEYTNYLIEKQGNSSPEAQALKKLSEEVENVKKSQKDDIEKRFDAAVQERRKAVNLLVETNEDFSSIKELKLQEAVVKHILDTWENDGIDLDPLEAAKEVEKEILDRAGKWSALSKLKSQTSVTEGEKKSLPPLKPGIKTLTNNMAATGEIKRPVKSFQHMTDSERYAEARRRAEEKLKLQGR